MTSQVVRLTTGDVIQVRTGVIQGIGPMGPTGSTGSVGIPGPQGAQGFTGPAGSVLNFSTAVSSGVVPLAASAVVSNTLAYTLMPFASVNHDDLFAVKSLTNFQFIPGADYGGQVTIKFFKQNTVNGSGSRAIRVMYAGVIINESTEPASILIDTVITVAFSFRCTLGTDILQVMVAQNDVVSLSLTGNLWVNEIGPGPQGTQGVPGIQGTVGAVGPQGVIGPAGAVANNTTTYATLGGTNL